MFPAHSGNSPQNADPNQHVAFRTEVEKEDWVELGPPGVSHSPFPNSPLFSPLQPSIPEHT